VDVVSQASSCAVLILGCGRSGTSIFGELFEHIPRYTYYSEPPFDTVTNLNFSKPIAIKVPTESSNYPAPEGLSFPIDVMLSILPASRKLYWQVRHPLDTIASLRVGISTNWGHHPRPPDWQAWLSKPLIERCAYHWAYINTVGFGQVQHLVEISHFEPMLVDPVKFTHRICSDIGINLSECEPELAKWYERVQNTNNAKFVEAKTSSFYSRNDHKTRIGRWEENLSQEEVRQVIPIVKEAAANFGYELPN
jgi:hypothetical protein